MKFKRAVMAHAVSCALAGLSMVSHAQSTDKSLAPVVVTADPFGSQENATILSPARVLSGDALRDKIGGSLGDTLMQELGVSSSSFSIGASRPIIRGLDGPRVEILQNGMVNGDLSSISNDHAVSAGLLSARQIEILRGPSTLLYGSGAIGGAVNIVNGRIPTQLVDSPTGEAEFRATSVDSGGAFSFNAERAAGKLGLHLDGTMLRSGDYRFPGNSLATGIDGENETGRLSFSGNRENNLGVGASVIESWGYVGASVSQVDRLYGIHGRDEVAKIDLRQTRFDVDSLIRSPLSGFDSLRVKLGQSDYKHTELVGGTEAAARFLNRMLESRIELSHQPVAGWRGRLGLQAIGSTVEAPNLEDPGETTVPRTRSNSTAVFIVEETDIGSVRLNAGARVEQLRRRPMEETNRNFQLGSVSVGTLWNFMAGYSLISTLSMSQRAPTTEELYSSGPHHPTETYDQGNVNLRRETSRNIDIGLQKSEERLRWRGNVFQNNVSNFVYSRYSVSDPGVTDMDITRSFSQNGATIRGYELETSYNLFEFGWFGRVFTDDSRGTLNNLGYLALQPVRRVGATIGYQDMNWRSSLSVINASSHHRTAISPVYEDENGAIERATKGYSRVDANISWRQRIGENELTWFVVARNLLNEEIRLSTSLLRDYQPQPGRNFILGVRARF